MKSHLAMLRFKVPMEGLQTMGNSAVQPLSSWQAVMPCCAFRRQSLLVRMQRV